jgi:precorrin-8X/cobalt-precorrin-8 methylmutase
MLNPKKHDRKQTMKSLLVCIISNKFESEVVRRTEALLAHRLANCDVRSVAAARGFSPSDLARMCKDACSEGYQRIYVQGATLAFSNDTYRDFMFSLENVRQSEPDVELTVFPPSQLHETCADLIERNVYHTSLRDTPWQETPPDEIQNRSFEFISGRLAKTYKDPDIKSVVVRVIHATADFGIERLLRFSEDAVTKGKTALKNGCTVITDVGMVSAGLTTRFKGRTINAIAQDGVAEYAREKGLTRSAAGMELLAGKIDGSVVAIGNAPTALVHLLSVMKGTDARPACVVGVPVGFVGAAESKELLMASDIPHISITGNRGGSPIAVAAVNAMGCL